jgi:hypothetical protein
LDERSGIEIAVERFGRHAGILEDERALGTLLELQWDPAWLATIDDPKVIPSTHNAIIEALERPLHSFTQIRINGHSSAGPRALHG